MRLDKQEALRVTNRYIGVSSGYLGDFTYRSHTDFYPEYCGIYDIFPDELEGTTRERFIEILTTQSPDRQAKILRGVIEKFGGTEDAQRLAMRKQMEAWIDELSGVPSVTVETPASTRKIVRLALSNADALIRSDGPSSAVDRVHTALHGHLCALCDAAGISTGDNPSMTALMKALRENHPRLQASGPYADGLSKVVYAMSTVLHQLNEIRNNATPAHPNDEILDRAEARLAINAAMTIFAYVDEKTGGDEPEGVVS